MADTMKPRYREVPEGTETEVEVGRLLGLEDVQGCTHDMRMAWPIAEKCARRMGYKHSGYRWEGPLFKPEDHYLTTEGYPLGTEGWFVHLEACGRILSVVADTPALAVCRAVVCLYDLCDETLAFMEAQGRKASSFGPPVVTGLFSEIDARVERLG